MVSSSSFTIISLLPAVEVGVDVVDEVVDEVVVSGPVEEDEGVKVDDVRAVVEVTIG
jgi:hypothetical protein